MDKFSYLPNFRPDLEAIINSQPEGQRSFLIRDPNSEKIFELREEDYFICKQLDGKTKFEQIQSAFMKSFKLKLGLKQLESFVIQLREKGLLLEGLPKASSPLNFFIPVEEWINWDVFNIEKISAWLAVQLRWCYTRTFVITSIMIIILAAGTLCHHFSEFLSDIKVYFVPVSIVYIELIFYLCLNIPSQIMKGVTASYYGGGPDKFSLHLMHNILIFPFFYCTNRIEQISKKSGRNWTLFSSTYCLALISSLGVFCWRMTPPGTGLHTFWVTLSVVGMLMILVGSNVFWDTEASYIVSNWLDAPELRKRSIAVIKAWFFRRPLPEPLACGDRRLFMIYGLLAEGITLISIFACSFFLITNGIDKYKGYGALAILIMMIIKYHKALLSLFSRIIKKENISGAVKKDQGGLLIVTEKFKMKGIRQMVSKRCEHLLEKWDNPAIRKSIIYKLLIVGLIFIIICPYRFCPSGVFKIQPLDQQSIQAQAKGKIEAVFIKEGDWVKKGDLIAQLSNNNIKKDIDSLDEKKPALVEVRSSVDGRVAALYTDKQLGRMLEVSDQLAAVEDSRKVIAEIYLNECDIGEVELAMPVKIKTWAYSGRAFTGGKVIEIASAIVNKDAIKSKWSDVEQDVDAVRILNTQGDEIARITAEFPNPNNLLKPGMTGYAKIIGRWTILGNLLTKDIFRFIRVEVWSWLP